MDPRPPSRFLSHSESPRRNGDVMETAQAECEQLLGAVLPFAQQMLEKHGGFHPFGGTLSESGEIAHTAGWTGEEHPHSLDVIDLLKRRFREGAKVRQYRATALVFDIRTIPPGKQVKQDAIAVALDHRDKYSVSVIFPYSLGSGGRLLIEEPFAVPGEHKIFEQ